MTMYKKKVSLGNFLKKGIDFKENDILEIANEGKQIEGQFGTQDVFLVKSPTGIEGNVSFNQTTLNNLIDGYGESSLNWIGKKVKVWGILSNVQGKMIRVYYFLHPDTTLNEATGEFNLPGGNIKQVSKDEIPVIEEGEDIDVKSIPF